MGNKLVSIVMPAFNEESRIRQAVEELKKVSFAKQGFGKEIIVVNDGSTDNTLKVLQGIKGISLISSPKNRGKGFALRQGFARAKGEVIAVQDADLEYAPKNIALLLEQINKGEEVAYGSRFLAKPKNMSFTFYFGNKFLSVLTTVLFGQKITDMETCQKVFSKNALKKLELSANGFDIEPELTGKAIKAGFKIKEIPIPYKAREKAEKKINVMDGIRAAWTLVKVRFS